MDLIRNRNVASLQHSVVQLFLFQFGQLIVQFSLIDRLADRRTRDSLGNFFTQGVLFSKFLPASLSTTITISKTQKGTYIVSSTLSILSLPWICDIASPARSMAARVSLLIFAASIEYICCSSVATCAVVCSSVCSCCFFLRRAAFAAIPNCQSVARLHMRICEHDQRCLLAIRSHRRCNAESRIATYHSYWCSHSS